MSRPIDADAVKGLIRSGISVDTYADQDYVCELVDGIPTIDAESEWVPCSERLPNESGYYLSTIEDAFGDAEICVIWFAHSTDYNYESEWREITDEDTVLAWMPLPKPYGERKDQ